MKYLCLSVLALAFFCLPTASSSDESDECAPGQILGQWYVHGIGSNCEWMVEFLVKEMMTCNVTSQKEGSFTISTNCSTVCGSIEVEMTFTKQKDGTYLQKSEWGDKILEKKETDCKTYIISSSRDLKENDGKFCTFVSLYARGNSVSPSLKQSFVDFAMERQIDRGQIFLLEAKGATTKPT